MSKLFDVDKSVWKKAAELFERTEESLDDDVATIKKWLKAQPHLPETMEDIKIKNFLILNKCSIEKTKQKIDMYYTVRSVISDLYEEGNPKLPHMKEFFDYTYFCISPKLYQGLYRVYFYKLKVSNTYAPKETSMQLANYSEVRLTEDCMVGDIWVIDTINSTIHDMARTTPSLLSKLLTIYQKVYSLRIKAVYFVNSPSYIATLMALMKAVLKPKIFDRIQVRQDAEILKEVFPKDELPKDYGGEGPSLDELQEMLKEKLAEYQHRFDVLDNLKVDESLRPEKLDNDEVLGFHGNFKKLSVD